MMKELIFNIHDLALLLTFMNCLMLAVFQLFLTNQGRVQTRLLALFFANQAVATIATLLYWSEPLRALLAPNHLLLVFFLHLSYIAQGPLLYLYTSALVNRRFNPRRTPLPHALLIGLYPLVAVSLYLMLQVTGGDEPEMIVPHERYRLLLETLHLLQRAITLAYGVFCIRLVLNYRRSIRDRVSNLEHTDPGYLTILLIGFTFSWLWSLLTHLSYYTLAPETSDLLGIANNYLNFILLLALFTLSVMHASRIQAADLTPERANTTDRDVPPEAIEQVRQGMEEKQLYLETNINIEAFSERIDLPVRETSLVINRHLNTNFFEYINSHRVAAAQAILADPAQADKSITDILLECGFNSKTAFNRFFKRVTGTTPSQYRQAAQAAANRKIP